MNVCIFHGRLTKDVTTYGEGDNMVAKVSIAVPRKKKVEGQPEADFPNLVFFGKLAQNVAKYTKKGQRINVRCRVNTGDYMKDGVKIYTTDFIVEELEFVETKSDTNDSNVASASAPAPAPAPTPAPAPEPAPAPASTSDTPAGDIGELTANLPWS